MKKMTVLFLVLMFAFSACASAEQLAVAISDDAGMLVFCDAALEVSDVDDDGNLTVYDALYAAHQMGYDGGAAAGLDTGDFGYGLSLTKLWGVDNGGSYGYYVNDMAAMPTPILKTGRIPMPASMCMRQAPRLAKLSSSRSVQSIGTVAARLSSALKFW